MNRLSIKAASTFASAIRYVSKNTINTACVTYFYEPKQPQELNQLNKMKNNAKYFNLPMDE
ncbi:MAG: cyclic lactone autoinducer peptide [Peptococcaceae bacterium]|nr:cyclic lactone autoinducer peptide [Peptococcaceae bacterium]